MRKLIVLTTMVALLGLAVWQVGGASAGGPPAVKPGATFAQFHLTGDVLPSPPYGTIDVPGSGGKVVVNQPNGEVSAVITSIANGLLPDTTYKVYIMNYNRPGAAGWSYSHYGPWTLVGTFDTDTEGHGDFHMNIWGTDMPAGTYELSVWINDASAGKTVLVSDNFQVVIDG